MFKEIKDARKSVILMVVVAVIVLFVLLGILDMFGCLSCNVFADSCVFWDCMKGCVSCSCDACRTCF